MQDGMELVLCWLINPLTNYELLIAEHFCYHFWHISNHFEWNFRHWKSFVLKFETNWKSVKYKQVNDIQFYIVNCSRQKSLKEGSEEGITTIENYLQIETELRTGKSKQTCLIVPKIINNKNIINWQSVDIRDASCSKDYVVRNCHAR